MWGVGRGFPSPENFGIFSLEMAHFGANSVVNFNRNVRQLTARTTIVTCIHVLLAAEGGGVRSNQSNPLAMGLVVFCGEFLRYVPHEQG